jgi:hypothetical protein
MKNTTKLKNILQLYTISLDMNDDDNIILTAINKRTKSRESFIDKSYTVVIRKAFSHMLKEMKNNDISH